MRDRMTQLEERACGWKGIHQFPTVDYNLGRLCLGHRAVSTLFLVEETKRKRPHVVGCEVESVAFSSDLKQLREL